MASSGSNFHEVYQLGSVMSKGSFARVYEGSHRPTGVHVAVKIYFNRFMNQKMVASEIDCLRKLNHPNIVKLTECYVDQENTFLCLERLNGRDLFFRITSNARKRIRYSEAKAREYARSILSAIKHCHDKNIVHRDIKAENIVMESTATNSTLKLVDFGFAVQKDGLLMGSVGSPSYCAPELLTGNLYGKPVDMWAYGVLVYLLLAGKLPFAGASHAELCANICGGKFIIKGGSWDQVSDEAKDFLSGLLRVNTADRLDATAAQNHPWVIN